MSTDRRIRFTAPGARTPADHLEATVSDRGLRSFPPVPATTGRASVSEALPDEDGPSMWLRVSYHSGSGAVAHMSTAHARRFAEQIMALADEIDREWGG